MIFQQPDFEGLHLSLRAILFQTVFCFAFLGNYSFISDQKVKAKAVEVETAFFRSLGNPKDRTLDHFFYASHIRHDFTPEKMKTRAAHF